jgi:hypothetical protein
MASRGFTWSSLTLGQALHGTGFLGAFYEDDIMPIIFFGVDCPK